MATLLYGYNVFVVISRFDDITAVDFLAVQVGVVYDCMFDHMGVAACRLILCYDNSGMTTLVI